MAPMESSPEDQANEPQSAEEWKARGGEAYARKDWQEAANCYTAALERCQPDSDLALTCLNNRAACHNQQGHYVEVIQDTSKVIKQQPANMKALLRRMVALDTVGGRTEEALRDASAILTMEPKNSHALQIVAKKRKNLTKANELPTPPPGCPEVSVAVFLFSEDHPLQCYSCLRSLRRHLKCARLQVTVLWQAADRSCFHSYQLLQSLPEINTIKYGEVAWVEASKGKLFDSLSRSLNRLSVEGMRHVLLLSDTAVFHSDVDMASASAVLSERREAFAVRLDLNPRISHFPEALLYASSPHLKPFASNASLAVWKRQYDASKQAYEAVPRESGWNEILNWTASLVRVEQVQHFFSALRPPLDTVREIDEKAADWLSRRQRMKQSEVSHRTACFVEPVLVTLSAERFKSSAEADSLLRSHLHRSWGPGSGPGGKDRFEELASKLAWSQREISTYFQNVKPTEDLPPDLDALLEPERYRELYLDSVELPLTLSVPGLPQQLVDQPLVSWLVPARNAEDFLLHCLQSIEAQVKIAAGAFEVVVVEDASEDGSAAILQKYAESRPYVRIIDNGGVQMGVAGSLAEGWRHCRGHFIARLDADDEAEPDRLLKQLSFMEQHPSISVLGGRVLPFFTEQRKFTVERVAKKENGRLVASVWREFHGQQTSRKREQLTIVRKGDKVVVAEGPAEYLGCQVLQVGEESMALHPEKWQKAFSDVQGLRGEVILQRSDGVEPARGSQWLHPCLVKAASIFEDCIEGTTAMLRRAHFGEESPFPREEAEGHWCCLALASHQHAANLADPLVRKRRHENNRAARDEAGILESKYAAIQFHLTKVHAVDVDMHDAAALLNFRGPRTPEQGEKLLRVLEKVERTIFAEDIRPQDPAAHTDFLEEFVHGREAALERAIVSLRMRFKALHEEVAAVITSVPEHSPRQHRSRTPPR
eukprot:TRINITY_DN76846_c0_g1_i1.p1 TRINITY_DN76846_c0_g1~~TRINITY_DN76846_c0_g1_i1.p1  ORF type:complete len:938 (+),score=191.22 TRINITY_DN76846_c0_g1_i1:26-2839(+)